MINPIQRQAWRRKGLYFLAIIGLFVLSMFWRGSFALGNPRRVTPSANAWQRTAEWLTRQSIESQALRLELRELEQGDPELSGEIIRRGVMGFRGFMTAFLWREMIEKQKRGELADMEVLVRLTTKLQPHFAAPWHFQSWNIAYNVSVDQHRLGDMYFYIARGIDLLAEGQRLNKRSPDMRYEIAFYYQNKFGVTDKQNTLRSLFSLSCIRPNERHPSLFKNERGEIDLSAFKKFCEDNPHLVRRLKEKLNCRTPLEVVEFLEENYAVPSRFKNEAGDYASETEQFPILPPRFDEGPDEWKPSDVGPDDDKSAYRAARAWYAYSLLLVPPPMRWPADNRPIPGPSPQAGPPGNPAWDQYDPIRYRMPRRPMLIIFRQGAPRAQSYQADLEEKEGWFDDAGWRPDEGVDEANRWFKDDPDAVFGRGRSWAGEQWRDAHNRWRRHGEETGLIIDPGRMQALREAAGGDVGTYPERPADRDLQDPAVLRRYSARVALYYYDRNRQVTNFPYFLAASEAEMQPEAMVARKALWQAEQARQNGNTAQAIRLYADAFAKIKSWLSRFDEYARIESLQEDLYEAELRYLRLLTEDDREVRRRALERYDALVRVLAPALPRTPPADERTLARLRQDIAEQEISPFARPKWNNEPWITERVKEMVKMRLGTISSSAAQNNNSPSAAP